jgi:hypothetical protein
MPKIHVVAEDGQLMDTIDLSEFAKDWYEKPIAKAVVIDVLIDAVKTAEAIEKGEGEAEQEDPFEPIDGDMTDEIEIPIGATIDEFGEVDDRAVNRLDVL